MHVVPSCYLILSTPIGRITILRPMGVWRGQGNRGYGARQKISGCRYQGGKGAGAKNRPGRPSRGGMGDNQAQGRRAALPGRERGASRAARQAGVIRFRLQIMPGEKLGVADGIL